MLLLLFQDLRWYTSCSRIEIASGAIDKQINVLFIYVHGGAKNENLKTIPKTSWGYPPMNNEDATRNLQKNTTSKGEHFSKIPKLSDGIQ